MGLPLFVAPIEPEEAAKTADKSAAHSRSAIRRQRSIRRPSHQLRPEERGIRTPFEGSSTPPIPEHVPDFTDVVSPTEEVVIEANRARVAAGRRLHGLPATASLSNGDTHRMSRSSRDNSSSPPQRRTGAPPLSRARVSSTTPPMPPVPESRDFQGSNRPVLYARRGRSRRWADYRRTRENYQMERYPILPRRETASDLATNGSGPQLPALSPNFSPARRYTLEESRDRPRSNSPPSFAYYPSYSADTGQLSSQSRVRSPSRDLHEFRSLRDLPPLRRMDRQSTADLEARRLRVRAARLDGLGDRDRSLSPDGEGAWETMYSTLTPDPQLPSVGSSFASASAATSASSTSDSQGTSLTTMSSIHNESARISAVIENVCDILEDSNTSSAISDTEAEEEEDIYGLQDDNAARDRFWRSYADVVASRADRVARHHGALDSDNLGGMQRIVRRLARREDIPDEWWTEAGLSRNLPRETVRLQFS